MTYKIALVQPEITAGESLGIRKAPESIQLLAAQLEREGHEVRMFHQQADDSLIRDLKEFSPNMVGISTMTANFPEGKYIANAIKSINQKITTVLGGWHSSGVITSYLSRQEDETIQELLSSTSPFDYVVAGEGAKLLPKIVGRLEHNVSVNNLQGVGYFDQKGIHASLAERIMDYDSLAFPSWAGLDINNYKDQRTGELDLSIHSVWACRFLCSFCSTSSVYRRGVRMSSPKRSSDLMEQALKLGPQTITDTSEDYFANLDWVKKTVDLYIERGFKKKYGMSIDTFISVPDLYTMEKRNEGNFLRKMHDEAGFNSFTEGIESFNAKTLKGYNKELMILPMMTEEQRKIYKNLPEEKQNKMLVSFYRRKVQRSINFAQNNGILVVGDYMVGNPEETEEETKKGFEMFSNLKNILVAYIPIYTPFPGTPSWKEAYESGRLIRTKEGLIDWSRGDGSKSLLNYEFDIHALRNSLEFAFYTSPRYQQDMWKAIKSGLIPKEMFEGRYTYMQRIFGENKVTTELLKELARI